MGFNIEDEDDNILFTVDETRFNNMAWYKKLLTRISNRYLAKCVDKYIDVCEIDNDTCNELRID